MTVRVMMNKYPKAVSAKSGKPMAVGEPIYWARAYGAWPISEGPDLPAPLPQNTVATHPETPISAVAKNNAALAEQTRIFAEQATNEVTALRQMVAKLEKRVADLEYAMATVSQ
jgi:hypothetical protein